MFCQTWWCHRNVMWGMDGTYSNGNPCRVCVSSRFAIRGGTAWKSCEGWMGPNPKGTHCRFCVSPHFAIRGCSTLCICEARMHSIQKECLRLDVVHAAAWCMDTVSISERYYMGTLPDVLARKVLFCRYTNNDPLVAEWVPNSSQLIIIGRDE
jgi:hypothetical protein